MVGKSKLEANSYGNCFFKGSQLIHFFSLVVHFLLRVFFCLVVCFWQGSLKVPPSFFGRIKNWMPIYGNFEGFPENDSDLFGVVILL